MCSFLPPELCTPFSGLSWLVFLPGGQPTEFFRALCSVHPAIQKNRHNDPLSPSVSASCFKHLALWHTLHEGPCVLGFYQAGVPTVWVFSKAENKVQKFGDPGMTSFFCGLVSCPHLMPSNTRKVTSLLSSMHHLNPVTMGWLSCFDFPGPLRIE